MAIKGAKLAGMHENLIYKALKKYEMLAVDWS